MKTDNEQQYLWESLSFFDEFSRKTPLPEQVEHLERTSITDALYEHKGNRSKAAASLGIGRTNLIAKLKKYKI